MPEKKKTFSLTDLALGHPSLTLLLLLGTIVAGVLSYLQMGVDLFPRVRFPLVGVTVVDPGESPDGITKRIVVPLEGAISALPGILHVHSTVVSGGAVVTAVFKDSELASDTRARVGRAVRHLRASFPKSVTSVRVKRENPTRQPLLWILFPEQPGEKSTAYVASTLVPALERIPGVGKIEALWPPSDEVRLVLTAETLKKKGVSIPKLALWLRERGRDYPAGQVGNDKESTALEVRGIPLDRRNLLSLSVPLPSGRSVPLSSIATLSTAPKVTADLFRFDGKPAIALRVFSSPGANLVLLSSRVRHRLSALIRPGAPGLSALKGIPATVAMDRSVEIAKNNRELLETLVLGGGLAVLSILVFLGNLRETAVAAVAIPASVLAVFPLVRLFGFSLNTLTMLALSLVVGILIDDAIVVLESINRHRSMGETLSDAARSGVGEIGRAVVATTLSVVAVFAPMAMMHGVLGEFFREFGWTVSIAVLASLLVSLTVTPVLAGRFRRRGGADGPHPLPSMVRFGRRASDLYMRGLDFAMNRPLLLFLVSLSLLGGSLVLAKRLPWNLIPEEDRGSFLVHVQISGSPSLARTDRILEEIAGRVRTLSGVRSVLARAGGRAGTPPSEGFLYVALTDRSRRTVSDTREMELTRKILVAIPGVTGSVGRAGPLGGTGETPTFQCFLLGPDPKLLERLGKDLVSTLESIPGMRDVRTSSGGEGARIVVRPNPKAMVSYFLTPGRLAAWLSTLTEGAPAGMVRTSSGPLPLRVLLSPSDALSLDKVGQLPFSVAPGRTVPLSSVADLRLETASLRENRDDRSPSLTVSAQILPPLSLGATMDSVDLWARKALPPSYHLRYAGNADVLQDAKGQILTAVLVSVGGVFMILAFLFGSLLLPLVIMVSIPFGVVGAVLGLWISGISVNMMGAIGLIILFGLVTKNAILLVDHANRQRRSGKTPQESARLSARVRLRPIAMTTLAMVFGMLPMAVGLGAGGRIRESMAVVVIGGLLSSMIFTLFLVPVVYAKGVLLAERWGRAEEPRNHKEEEGHGI